MAAWFWKTPWPSGALLSLGLLAVAGSGCGGDISLASRWAIHQISVDGNSEEWAGDLQEIDEDKEEIAAALRNDAHHLYVLLAVRSPDRQLQLLLSGCTVWIDPTGSEDKAFGIHYPIERDPRERSRGEPPHLSATGQPGEVPGGPGSTGDPSNRPDPTRRPPAPPLDSLLAQTTDLIEIRGIRWAEMDGEGARARGIDVALASEGEDLVYELQLPLQDVGTGGFAAGAGPGQTILIGLEIPALTPADGRGPGRGMGPGGSGGRGGGGWGGADGDRGGGSSGGRSGRGPGGGGRGGFGPPEGMGPRGGDGDAPADAVEIWAEVTLATQPSDEPGEAAGHE